MFVRLGSTLSYSLVEHCGKICIDQFVYVVFWKVRVNVTV